MFNKDDKQHCLEIGGRNATVVGGSGKHDHGSSRVKLKNIVDYKWEQKNYPGRLIACHNEGKLIAYAITGEYGRLSKLTSTIKREFALQ